MTNQEAQALTWGESYVLMTHLLEYRAAPDPRLLSEFVFHADSVLAVRDDETGYDGGDPVWKSTWATVGNVPYAGVVDTGMITGGLADFAALVLTDEPALADEVLCDGRMLGAVALDYVARVSESVEFHEPEWNPDVNGYLALPETAPYVVATGDWGPLADYEQWPYNISHALGRTIAHLYRATGAAPWRARVEALSQGFKDALSVEPDGACEWLYWYPDPTQFEDISHGLISVDFAFWAHAAGVGFRGDEIACFGRTLAHRLIDGPTVHYNVNGTNIASGSDYNFAALWLITSTYYAPAKPPVMDLFAGLEPNGAVDVDIAAAAVHAYGGSLPYGAECTRDSQCESNLCYAGAVCGDPLGLGSGCTRHLECATRACIDGTCQD